MYLLAPSNVPYFTTQEGSVIILKMANFSWKYLAIFHNVYKIDIYFASNVLFLFLKIVNEDLFFQEYLEIKLKYFS